MRFKVLIILSILILGNFTFADCIDDQGYQFSEHAFSDFWLNGRPRLASLPQKITKMVDGITFTSDYDNGSLEDVVYAGPDEFDCTIYEEPGALGPRKYWFRFQMIGVAGRTVTLNIDHAANPRPVISLDGVTWRRLTAAEAPSLYEIVLSFGAAEDFAELAFFYPYGVAEIYQEVDAIVRSSAYASSQTIGQSYQGRDMWMVTVTDTSVLDTGKHRVWVHSRVHAGEVTATPTVLGMLELITEDSPLGARLRKYCIFNIVPLMNVDGVFLGQTRWDSQGYDIERDWCVPITLPEVANIKAQVDSFIAGPNPIEVALNLHSTQGNYTDTFFFKHVQPSVTANFEIIQQNYIDAFNNATPLFDNLNPYTSQLHACQFIESYFWNNWGESVMALTYEGHYYRRITDSQWISDHDYRELGHALMAALIEYFDLPVDDWAFEPPPQGWSYRTAAPPSDIPDWDDATSAQVLSPGALCLTAPVDETTDHYGSWDNYSGDPNVPAISWVDNSAWQAIFTMSTDKPDPNTVPSIRLRFVENHMKATSYMQVSPGGWLPIAERGISTTDYKLYFRPPITDNGFFLAFDLIDFGQPFALPCDGTVYLEEVVVDRFDLTDPTFDSDWTDVTTYSGTGLHSWTHSSAGLPYLTDVDSYTTITEGLEQTTTMAQTRAFGAWTSPADEVDLITDQFYRAVWTLSCEDSTLGGAQRVRMHAQDFRYSSYMAIDRDAYPANTALPSSGGKDYYLYAEFPGILTVDKLLLAWDLYDFDSGAGGWANLTNVIVSRKDLP